MAYTKPIRLNRLACVLTLLGSGLFMAIPTGADDDLPTTSVLNTRPGTVVSNATIAAPNDDRALCIYSLTTTDLVVDMMGSIAGSFEPLTPFRVLDTRT